MNVNYQHVCIYAVFKYSMKYNTCTLHLVWIKILDLIDYYHRVGRLYNYVGIARTRNIC